MKCMQGVVGLAGPTLGHPNPVWSPPHRAAAISYITKDSVYIYIRTYIHIHTHTYIHI